MFSTTDTIVAIATPPGRGGIGVVRVSGPSAHTIACALLHRSRSLTPRHATMGRVRARIENAADDLGSGPIVDEVVATYFPGPRSYTGDDVVELSGHGSPVILRAIVAGAMSAGARLAEPGEFTLRAFLNGRIDLPQAEAVADLVDAVTPLQARAAFDQLQGTLTGAIGAIDAELFDLIARLEASIDFPDEGYHFIEPDALGSALGSLLARTSELLTNGRRGRLIREGFTVAIVGRPNVGKSSLFNALVGSDRAIVTAIPGTTRDVLTESVDIGGIRVTLIDTAGVRDTEEIVEAEGVRRARDVQRMADLVLVVVDASRPAEPPSLDGFMQIPDNKGLVVVNKVDCEIAGQPGRIAGMRVSARTGEGIDCLRQAIGRAADVESLTDPPLVTNLRHLALVERAQEALQRARSGAAERRPLSEEFLLADLQEARAALEEISGRRAPEDLLAHIFSRFCVGK